MSDRSFIPASRVCEKYEISRTTVWRIVNDPCFPKEAIRRVGRAVRYDVALLDAFLNPQEA